MKKIIMVIFVILLIFAGCKEDNTIEEAKSEENLKNEVEKESQVLEQIPENDLLLIKDHIDELDNNILEEIVKSYFLVFGFDMSFNEDELMSFENAFKYIMSAGTYNIQPFDYMEAFETYYDSISGNYIIPIKVVDDLVKEDKINPVVFTDIKISNDNYVVEPSDRYMRWDMRPEVYQYFNKKTEMVEIPINIVDAYILSKFNTTVDYSQIEEYNKENNMYIYYPFIGDFYYDISIDEVDREGEIVRFSSTLTNNLDNGPNDEYKAIFVIEFIDGEYKFLSVDIIS